MSSGRETDHVATTTTAPTLAPEPAPTHSALLRAKIELLMPRLFRLSARVWDSPALGELYPRYLCALHSAIRATVPLMETALERARALAEAGDPVAAGTAEYLARHIREERGHDEWLRQDLAAIGRDPDEPLRTMPTAGAADLVGAQYYWIRHYHPVCLLGHIAVLEGYPPSPDFADLLQRRTGYPADGFRTLRRHAALDIRHRDELMRAIDRLPLGPEHQTALGVSALHTLRATSVLFEEILATAPGPVPQPA
ncbi:iron-containing redox enzyme family protein [Streptomyces sp. NPDC001100]